MTEPTVDSRPRVLIVDDNRDWRETLLRQLPEMTNREYAFLEAADGATAIKRIHDEPEIACVILDYQMPEKDGLEVSQELQLTSPHIPIIMMSSVAPPRIRQQARATIPHYLDVSADDMVATIRNLVDVLHRFIPRVTELSDADVRSTFREHGVICESSSMLDVCRAGYKAAHSLAPVLITGEHGAETLDLALAIHTIGGSGDFRTIDCALYATEPVQLFNHLLGIATAEHGAHAVVTTVFLEDISLLSDELLHHVLDRVVDRGRAHGGGARRIRLIASLPFPSDGGTQAMPDALLQSRFGFVIEIPLLRKRLADMPALIRQALEFADEANEVAPRSIDSSAIIHLQRQPWPGSTAQLRDFVVEVAAQTSSRMIEVADVQRVLTALSARQEAMGDGTRIDRRTKERIGVGSRGELSSTEMLSSKELARARFRVGETVTREMIEHALSVSRGNMTRAAALLGYATKEGLKYWIGELKIDLAQYRGR